MEANILSKSELKIQIKRFIMDKERGIGIEHFCEIAGVAKRTFLDVFVYEKSDLTEHMQMRVNRAYNHWKEGRLVVMKRGNNTRYVDYRKTPTPPFLPQTGLKMTSEGIKISVGMVNRHDYSQPDLKEALRG